MQPRTRITAPHRRRRGGRRATRGRRGGAERTIRQTRILGLNSKLQRYTLQCAQRARESASPNDSSPPPRRRGKRDFPVLLAQGRERIRAVASAAPTAVRFPRDTVVLVIVAVVVAVVVVGITEDERERRQREREEEGQRGSHWCRATCGGGRPVCACRAN